MIGCHAQRPTDCRALAGKWLEATNCHVPPAKISALYVFVSKERDVAFLADERLPDRREGDRTPDRDFSLASRVQAARGSRREDERAHTQVKDYKLTRYCSSGCPSRSRDIADRRLTQGGPNCSFLSLLVVAVEIWQKEHTAPLVASLPQSKGPRFGRHRPQGWGGHEKELDWKYLSPSGSAFFGTQGLQWLKYGEAAHRIPTELPRFAKLTHVQPTAPVTSRNRRVPRELMPK